MKLLITGATGFLGKYVVAEALRREHWVRALVRPAYELDHIPWGSGPCIEHVRAELRDAQTLKGIAVGVDAVIHLAAAKSGNFAAQFKATVIGTENLLRELANSGIPRLVGISTFAVYDYLNLPSGSIIDEQSSLEQQPEQRDDYAQTKILQEQLLSEFAEEHGGQVTILRPGVIFGPGQLWSARLGVQMSNRIWVRTGAHARVPLTYVENCAEAIVLAAEMETAIGKTINIVDDDCPTQKKLICKLQKRAFTRTKVIPVNWTLLRALARCTAMTNRYLFANNLRTPGLLIPARLHARCKPLRYSNAIAKDLLGWQPRYPLESALYRCFDSLDFGRSQKAVASS